MEFQLSIHQLVLRKQLEKGEFQGALRQINEMHVDVESLQDRMLKLSHDIKRSIVSEETLKKYSSLLDDIYTRLQRENEEFDELRDFVKETKDRIYSDTLQQKQHNAYSWEQSNRWSGGEKWSKNMTLFLGLLNYIAEQLGFQIIALTAHVEGKFLRDYFPVVYSCRLRSSTDTAKQIVEAVQTIQTAYFKDHDPTTLERIGANVDQLELF